MTDVDAGWDAGELDGSTMMNRLAEVIDAYAWDEQSDLLHEDFVCSCVHTGERFDRGTWVRLNADYPGFDSFALQDCIGKTPPVPRDGHTSPVTEGVSPTDRRGQQGLLTHVAYCGAHRCPAPQAARALEQIA